MFNHVRTTKFAHNSIRINLTPLLFCAWNFAMYILQSVIMVWDFKWQYWQLLGDFVCCKIVEQISLWYQSIESSHCSKEMVSFNWLHFFTFFALVYYFCLTIKYASLQIYINGIVQFVCMYIDSKMFVRAKKSVEMKTDRMEKC